LGLPYVTSRGDYDHLTGADNQLGEGLTEAELYFWAAIKKSENREHRELGHDKTYGWCRECDNCRCGWSRFACRCSAGRVTLTPYRIRFQKKAMREALRAGAETAFHIAGQL
jgi:hypothetical protein